MFGKSIVVDCDAGIDDALALIILIAAHEQRKIQIKGITCVNGNTTVDNVVKNVYRTLHTCKATDIPVFKGAHSPLLATRSAHEAANEQYYGSDGLGDAFTNKVDTGKLQSEHAVSALNRIVSENPGNVTVVCLGPLTNIALAIRMYPEFVDNVKEFYVMGGNTTAQGNVTAQAEFNFYMDPEGAHILLNSNNKPMWLLPWETCLKSRISHEWRKDILGQLDKPCIDFMNQIEFGKKARKKSFPNYIVCDAVLAGILVTPDIAKDVISHHADVELHGNRTRGQVVLDHSLSNEPNVSLIQDFDSEMFKELLISSADTPA